MKHQIHTLLLLIVTMAGGFTGSAAADTVQTADYRFGETVTEEVCVMAAGVQRMKPRRLKARRVQEQRASNRRTEKKRIASKTKKVHLPSTRYYNRSPKPVYLPIISGKELRRFKD